MQLHVQKKRDKRTHMQMDRQIFGRRTILVRKYNTLFSKETNRYNYFVNGAMPRENVISDI